MTASQIPPHPRTGLRSPTPPEDPAPKARVSPNAKIAESGLTEVVYKRSEYVMPPNDISFVAPIRNAGGPEIPEPPQPPQQPPPEPPEPRTEIRLPRCSKWAVQLICALVGIATTMIGFACIATIVHFEAGMGIGGGGALLTLGVGVWYANDH